MRRILRLLHLWLALVTGALVVLVCVTGSILVYEEELDYLLSPDFFERQPSGPSGEPGSHIALARIADAARSHRPGAALEYLDLRHLPAGPALVNMRSPRDGKIQVSVDPVSGHVIGERGDDYFLAIVRALHIDLMAGDVGYTIVGFVGIGIFVMMASGLYLWWPRNGRWKQALTLKPSASPHRRNFDLHRVFGAYTFVPLFVAVATGIVLVFPEYTIDPLLSSDLERSPIREVAGTAGLSVDQLIPIARQEIPHGQVLLIHFPKENRPIYTVSFRSFENGHPRGRSYVHIYPDTGEIRWAKATRGASIDYQVRWEWLVPTHSGDIASHWGKVPILLSGLAPVGLMITGVLMWLRRRRARKLGAKEERGARSGIAQLRSRHDGLRS